MKSGEYHSIPSPHQHYRKAESECNKRETTLRGEWRSKWTNELICQERLIHGSS